MTRWTTLTLFVCFFFIEPATLFAERMTDNWLLTGYTKYRDAVFVDRARLSSPSPDAANVWIKIAPSQRSQYLKFINEYLRTVRKEGKGFKSVEILCEINCRTHLIRYTRFVYLDKDRNIIHEAYETGQQRYLIHEGSVWYPVEKEACLTRK